MGQYEIKAKEDLFTGDCCILISDGQGKLDYRHAMREDWNNKNLVVIAPIQNFKKGEVVLFFNNDTVFNMEV